MTAALRVIAPGLMTTLQDLGRRGYQHLGVPVSGALDPVCLQAANLLAGNAPGMGALEIAYQGPTLAIEADSVRIAAAGGQAAIDILGPDGGAGQRLAPFESARLSAGRPSGSAPCRAAPSSISRSRAASPSRRSWAASRRSRAAASAASRAARCRPATSSRCARRRRPSARR